MKTKINERFGKSRLGAIANVFRRFRPSHLCCPIILASLIGCTTTGHLVDVQSKVYLPVIGDGRDYKTVAVFLNWHSGCVLGECDTPRVALHDRAASCIQSGLRRVNPDLRAIAGPVELRQDTSALVADPRKHGQPDSRFDTDLVASLRKKQIRYAIVLDISRMWGGGARRPHAKIDMSGFAADPVAGFTLGRSTSAPVRARAEAILIDLDSRRWLARSRSDFKDWEGSVAAVAVVIVPIPLIWVTSSSAALSACEEVGENLGYLLLGKQGASLDAPGAGRNSKGARPSA